MGETATAGLVEEQEAAATEGAAVLTGVMELAEEASEQEAAGAAVVLAEPAGVLGMAGEEGVGGPAWGPESVEVAGLAMREISGEAVAAAGASARPADSEVPLAPSSSAVATVGSSRTALPLGTVTGRGDVRPSSSQVITCLTIATNAMGRQGSLG